MTNRNYLVLFVGIITLLSACNGRSVKESVGRMRIINASYLSGGANIDVDYKTVYASLTEYLNYSLYRDYISGRHPMQVKDANGNTVIDTAVNIVENQSTTVMIFDSMNTIRCRIYTEQYVTRKGSNCKIKFLNVSNNAPVVNIYQEYNTTSTFSGFGNGEYSEYMNFGVKNTFFVVKDSTTNTVLYTQPYYNLLPGYLYTVFLKGSVGSVGTDSLGLFVIGNNGDY